MNRFSTELVKGLSIRDRIIKRTFDFIVALCSILVLWPVILITWILARHDTGMSGFFCQLRVGRHGRLFKVVKIRTMVASDDDKGHVTTADDNRITRLGAHLRRWKLDELPQLFNVLIGDMSLVGPRPDVPGFADKLTENDRIVLSLRPGITGPATLKYRNEESLLASQPDPEAYNREVIFPDKVKINREYIHYYSIWKDFKYIIKTVLD